MSAAYNVIRNREGNYAVHTETPAEPSGWHRTGFLGTRAECLAHIEAVGTVGGAADPAPGPLLHELVTAQAARTPEAVAVECSTRTVTYGELELWSDRLAGGLRRRRVVAGTVVGVAVERSCSLVAALLAVLKAGGTYLPLDTEYPQERLQFMTREAQARHVLVKRADGTPEFLTGCSAEPLAVDDPQEWAGEPAKVPIRAAAPGDSVYALYTSGSTGRPKGVLNTHRAVINRLHWMQQEYELTADDVVLHKTPVGFDVSVWELFWPLLNGARMVVAEQGGHRDPAYLRELMIQRRITVVHFVPSMLSMFLAATDGVESGCGATGPSLRTVVCSGEELPVTTAREFLRRFPGCSLHNLYGPTEAAIDVSHWHCTADSLRNRVRVPIGRAIRGMRLHVLGHDGRPVPSGTTGELHIAGVGLAVGYLAQPGLTADRFLPDPFGPPGTRLYRTGDLARWNQDGDLEYLGRTDTQVKLRGQRIELGEIEAVLRKMPDVRDAAVLMREDRPGDQRLAAYLLLQPGRRLDRRTLRLRLGKQLPPSMVPAAFVPMSQWPLTPNGKLDRAALPHPGTAIPLPSTEPPDESRRLLAPRPRADRAAVLRADSTLPADITAGGRRTTLDRPDPSAPLLLTGVTGFLGAFLLQELLTRTRSDVYCLVRAADEGAAIRRIRMALSRYRLWDERLTQRIIPVCGDLGQPRLGLDETAHRRLAGSARGIFHCAARVRHLEPYELSRPVNVDGTLEILRLATTGTLKSVHLVSTASAALGTDRNPAVVGEDVIPEAEYVPENGYVASKWVSERLVLQAAGRGVPAAIHRPGRVSGHSWTGAGNTEDAFWNFVRAMAVLGAVPELDPRRTVALVPVDHVAGAIVRLAERVTPEGETYHLVAPRPVPVADVVSQLRTAGYSLRSLTFDAWEKELVTAASERAADGDTSLAAAALLCSQYRGEGTGPTWGRDLTAKALTGADLPCPNVDDRALARSIAYFIDTAFFPSPVALSAAWPGR